jgi:hypothetical protein
MGEEQMNQPMFPIFNETRNPAPAVQNPKTNPPRKEQKTRFDKCHPMKFPISQEEERELRRLYKRYKATYQADSITVFTTMLLRFGLRNMQLVEDQNYKDTGIYKTVKPNQIEYNKIGGETGYAITWNLSERRALHRIVISVLKYMESGGDIGYAEVQPIRPAR